MATSQEINAIKTLAQINVDRSKELVTQSDDLTEPYFIGLNKNKSPKSDQVVFAKQQSAVELQIQSNEQSILDIQQVVTDGSANYQVLNLRQQNRDLAEAKDKIEDARSLAGDDTITSQFSIGEVIDEEKEARKENATVQTPPIENVPTANTPVTSNANETIADNDGNDINFQTSDDQGAISNDNASGSTGQGTSTGDRTSDDVDMGQTVSTAEKGITIPDNYTKPFDAQPNVLRELGHYTYQISIYLQSKDEYVQLVSSKEKIPTGDLIIQSGGISLDERVEEFKDYDYYIDDLEIESLMPQEVGGATNATSLSFKITEPYGFTFLSALKKAALRKMDGESSDFLKQHYLMVIRFFGEDDDVQQAGGTTAGGSATPATLVEKFIPFRINKITSKATTGAVEYNVEGLSANHNEGFGQKRAAIPFQVEIKGQTLNDLFNGTDDTREITTVNAATGGRENQPAVLTQPAGVNTTSKTSISTGLVTAMNNRMKKLADEGKIGIADKYKVTFDIPSGMASARIKPPGTVKKEKTAMSDPGLGASVYLSSRGQVDGETFLISANAGQQFQQFIDTVTRTSTYITDQQTFHLDPNTGDPKQNEKSNEVMAWFRIGVNTKPIGWDEIRNDWAYEIEYVVVPSQVSDLKSEFFPKSKFYGVHKKYNYWFTGENTEVLSYEVDYNALYYIGIGQEVPKLPTDSANKDDQHAKVVEPPTASSGGVDAKSSEPAARGASVLYSPTDYAQLRMEIYGDPAYIVQNDVFYGLGEYNDRFLPDGTINMDGFETLVEINWNTIEDYNDETGTVEIKAIEKKSTKQRDITGTDGMIYCLTKVTNKFNNGQFTQEVNGIMREFQESGVANSTKETNGDNVGRDETLSIRSPVVNVVGRSSSASTPRLGTTSSGPTRVTPVLGGLTLSGATFQAPDDDAS